MSLPSDDSEYNLLTYPGSELNISVARDPGRATEIRLYGNRPGILSLANILLWFLAREFEREVISLTSLRFAKVEGSASLSVRVSDEVITPEQAGTVRAREGASHFEWLLPEDDLRHVALSLHRMACFWEHEYDLYPYADEHVRDARIHARVIDVEQYLPHGRET